MKKHVYLSLLAICIAAGANAQSQEEVSSSDLYLRHQKKYTIAIQPVQLFNWGLRFDFEVRLGDGPGWLQFGPTGYYSIYGGSKDNPDYYYSGDKYYYEWDYHLDIREPLTQLKGGGLDINYKRFVNPQRSFYVAGGLSYAKFDIEYWGREWYDYVEDGLDYHEYRLCYHDQNIDRIGINTYFGYQFPKRRAFLLDMFIGVAYRYSFYNKSGYEFDETMISYGRRGLVFLTGVRIGFGFR